MKITPPPDPQREDYVTFLGQQPEELHNIPLTWGPNRLTVARCGKQGRTQGRYGWPVGIPLCAGCYPQKGDQS